MLLTLININMEGLLIFSILGLLWTSTLAQISFTCDPAMDCRTQGFPGAVVPDPNDCEKFYLCIQLDTGEIVPSTVSLPCDPNYFFDQTVGTCMPERIPGVCENPCIYQGTCSSECPLFEGTVTYAADRGNCSVYYICHSVGISSASCQPSAPYFNGVSCVAEKNQCCNLCSAYCLSAGSEIQDPCDCTSYYICLNPGTALENYRFTCDEGTYYDETTANCIPGTCTSTCSSTQCDSSGGPGITTTTTIGAVSTTTGSFSSTTIDPINPSGCTSLSSFTCPVNGNFHRCPYCQQSYFHCSNGEAVIAYCQGTTVFNTNDNYPYCLDPSNCPYP